LFFGAYSNTPDAPGGDQPLLDAPSRCMGKPVDRLAGKHPLTGPLRAKASRLPRLLTDKTSVPDTQGWRL
jgi:hypothetical protein